MNILAIDTSTKELTLALKKGDEVFYSVSEKSLQHSKILFSDLEALLEKAQASKEEIGCISVNLGPGSFTGIRIGVVFAKGMAYALGTKLVACDAFEAVALEAEEKLPFGVLLEERNGGGYFAVCENGENGMEISDRGVYSAEEIRDIIAKKSIERIISNSQNNICTNVTSGICGLIKKAEEAIKLGEFCGEADVQPVYIKKSQAEEQLEEKLKKMA